MTFIDLVFIVTSCVMTVSNHSQCVQDATKTLPQVALVRPGIERTGPAVDVVISAEAAVVWDIETGEILYAKQEQLRRPVASLTKLLSLLYVQKNLTTDSLVPIPIEARTAQRQGAHTRLPVGEHVRTDQLIAASLIASANDAIVSLAIATSGSEEKFVEEINAYAQSIGVTQTKAANATGLSGGEQYSTALDIKQLFTLVSRQPALATYLNQKSGVLTTQEGSRRTYTTTNELLGTYVPIVAAKTGFTLEAGENLAIITSGPERQRVGAVILGSTNRFQDMKVLIEWVWRNYTWPKN